MDDRSHLMSSKTLFIPTSCWMLVNIRARNLNAYIWSFSLLNPSGWTRTVALRRGVVFQTLLFRQEAVTIPCWLTWTESGNNEACLDRGELPCSSQDSRDIGGVSWWRTFPVLTIEILCPGGSWRSMDCVVWGCDIWGRPRKDKSVKTHAR